MTTLTVRMSEASSYHQSWSLRKGIRAMRHRLKSAGQWLRFTVHIRERSIRGLGSECFTESTVLPEFIPIFESFQKCLELRDKYMTVSGQMLGFNPKDHDGHFT